MAMSSKSIKCLLIVIALGIAGCSSDKTSPQKAEKSKTAVQKTAPSASQEAPGTFEQHEDRPRTATPAVAQKAPPAAEPVPESKTPDVIFVPTPPGRRGEDAGTGASDQG